MIGCFIEWLICYEDYEENGKKIINKSITPFIVCLILAIAIPFRDTAMEMVAIHLGQEIIETDKVQDISTDALDLLGEWIDKKQEELKNEK